MKIEAAHSANGQAQWHYFKDPACPPCPRGTKVQLLTSGFVAVYGEYKSCDNYVAWAPCIARDKAKEIALGLR